MESPVDLVNWDPPDNVAPEDPEDLLENLENQEDLDSLVLLDPLDLLVQLEKEDHLEALEYLDPLDDQDPEVLPDPLVQLVKLENKVPPVVKDQEETEDLPVHLVNEEVQERLVLSVHLVLPVQLVPEENVVKQVDLVLLDL